MSLFTTLEEKRLCHWFKSMAMFISILFSMLSCSAPIEKPDQKQSVLDELGIEDYEKIIRHPVSLNQEPDSSNWAMITFAGTIFYLDTIIEGVKVSKLFEFENTGSNALYILDTRVSCGCTVVSFDKNAIMPGDSGEIEVEFDSTEKNGAQDKSIIVISNSVPNETILKIEGFVKPD